VTDDSEIDRTGHFLFGEIKIMVLMYISSIQFSNQMLNFHRAGHEHYVSGSSKPYDYFPRLHLLYFYKFFNMKNISTACSHHLKHTGHKSSSMKTSKEGILYRVDILLWIIILQKLKWFYDNGGSGGLVSIKSCNTKWKPISHFSYFVF
jgi:hypothetical protein